MIWLQLWALIALVQFLALNIILREASYPLKDWSKQSRLRVLFISIVPLLLLAIYILSNIDWTKERRFPWQKR